MTEQTLVTESTIQTGLLRQLVGDHSVDSMLLWVVRSAVDLYNASGGAYLSLRDPIPMVYLGIARNELPSLLTMRTYLSGIQVDHLFNTDLVEPLSNYYSSWLVVPIYELEERIGCLFLVFHDTVQRSYGEDLRLLADGIVLVNRRAALQNQYRQLVEQKNSFARNVSHDLRSPLASIRGFVDMLLHSSTGTLNAQQERFANKILSGIEQVTDLIDDVRDANLYDVQTGIYEIDRSPTQLRPLLDTIVHRLEPLMIENDVRVSIHVEDGFPVLNLDSTMLSRALWHVIKNAIQYSPERSDVSISVDRNADSTLIRVRDHGIGIPSADKEIIFHPHVRLRHKEHSKIRGHGLGLTIAKNVAQQHGGNIWVESIEGKGSTFTMRIPLDHHNVG